MKVMQPQVRSGQSDERKKHQVQRLNRVLDVVSPVAENIRISAWIVLVQLVRTIVLVFVVIIVLVMADHDLTPVYGSVLFEPLPPLCRDPARLRWSDERREKKDISNGDTPFVVFVLQDT